MHITQTRRGSSFGAWQSGLWELRSGISCKSVSKRERKQLKKQRERRTIMAADECKFYCFKEGDYHCNKVGKDIKDDSIVKKYCWNYGRNDCPVYNGKSGEIPRK